MARFGIRKAPFTLKYCWTMVSVSIKWDFQKQKHVKKLYDMKLQCYFGFKGYEGLYTSQYVADLRVCIIIMFGTLCNSIVLRFRTNLSRRMAMIPIFKLKDLKWDILLYWYFVLFGGKKMILFYI